MGRVEFLGPSYHKVQLINSNIKKTSFFLYYSSPDDKDNHIYNK